MSIRDDLRALADDIRAEAAAPRQQVIPVSVATYTRLLQLLGRAPDDKEPIYLHDLGAAHLAALFASSV